MTVLATFPPKTGTFAVKQTFNLSECLICQDEVDPADESNEFGILEPDCCNKTFHISCLERWHKTKAGPLSCPHCTRTLDTQIFRRITVEDVELAARIGRLVEERNYFDLKQVFVKTLGVDVLDPTMYDRFPYTLHTCVLDAAKRNDLVAMTILKNRGCFFDSDAPERGFSGTPLCRALGATYSGDNVSEKAVELFLNWGSNPNGNERNRPLNPAYHLLLPPVIDALEASGADYALKDDNNLTPLISYFDGKANRARRGLPSNLTPSEELALVQKCISRGTDLNAACKVKHNKTTQTVLNFAAESAFPSTLEFLIERIGVGPSLNLERILHAIREAGGNLPETMVLNPIFSAVLCEGMDNFNLILDKYSVEVLKAIKAHKAEADEIVLTPLHIDLIRQIVEMEPDDFAKSRSFLQKVKRILAHNDFNVRDSHGNSTLHYLALKLGTKNPIVDEIFAFLDNLTEENGALFPLSKKGQIPLHFYASSPHLHGMHNKDLVKTLAPGNAINAQDQDGNTALHIALQAYNSAVSRLDSRQQLLMQKTIQDLVECGADIYLPNKKRLTPQGLSAKHPNDILRCIWRHALLEEKEYSFDGEPLDRMLEKKSYRRFTSIYDRDNRWRKIDTYLNICQNNRMEEFVICAGIILFFLILHALGIKEIKN